MQAEVYHVFGSGDSTTPLDQAGDRSLSFWGYILSVDSGLHMQVSGGVKLSPMTGQHVANQCKLIFSEYGWPETLISDNGPCDAVEAFTSVMNAYHVNHITSSSHYPQSNGLAEKYIQIVKNVFYKAREEGKDLFKCLRIYHNTPVSGSLQSSMTILYSKSSRFDLPKSNTARQQLGLQSEQLINFNKNEHLPLHDLYFVKRSCIKMLQASSGIQPLLPAYVHSKEAYHKRRFHL